MVKNATNGSMNSAARGSCIAGRTRSSSAAESTDSLDKLQSLVVSGHQTPAYVKQVVHLLEETRAEMKELSKRNEELLEELRRLKEENIFFER